MSKTSIYTMSTAELEALLETLDDSTARYDRALDELRRREDEEPHPDSPSLEDRGLYLGSYAS